MGGGSQGSSGLRLTGEFAKTAQARGGDACGLQCVFPFLICTRKQCGGKLATEGNGISGAGEAKGSDLPPINSNAAIQSPITLERKLDDEEEIYRRADHWVSA